MDLSRPDYLPSPTERRRVPGRMPAATRHRHAAQTDTRHRQTRGTNRHAAQTDTWHKQTRGTNRHAAQTRGTDTRHKQTRGTDRHAAQTDTRHKQTRGTNRHVAQTDTRHKQTRGTDTRHRHAAEKVCSLVFLSVRRICLWSRACLGKRSGLVSSSETAAAAAAHALRQTVATD
eukprot:COSAG06_NODE_2711_length_6401_cov_343.215192_4_plen_174_part_00